MLLIIIWYFSRNYFWPEPWPQPPEISLCLVALASASRFWPRLTSLPTSLSPDQFSRQQSFKTFLFSQSYTWAQLAYTVMLLVCTNMNTARQHWHLHWQFLK